MGEQSLEYFCAILLSKKVWFGRFLIFFLFRMELSHFSLNSSRLRWMNCPFTQPCVGPQCTVDRVWLHLNTTQFRPLSFPVSAVAALFLSQCFRLPLIVWKPPSGVSPTLPPLTNSPMRLFISWLRSGQMSFLMRTMVSVGSLTFSALLRMKARGSVVRIMPYKQHRNSGMLWTWAIYSN